MTELPPDEKIVKEVMDEIYDGKRSCNFRELVNEVKKREKND